MLDGNIYIPATSRGKPQKSVGGYPAFSDGDDEPTGWWDNFSTQSRISPVRTSLVTGIRLKILMDEAIALENPLDMNER
ncbi:MAG: hypothetical protein ABIR47_01020 [Candidatus Kapaibacterium sp.]